MESRDLASLARAQVESFNANDWDGVRASMLTDVVYDERATGRVMQGPDAIIEAMKGWKTFNSDDGPLETPGGTVPPTGKGHSTHGAWVMTFEGDKLRESRNYFDMLQLLQQVGAM